LDKTHGVTLQQLSAEPWFNTYRISTPETDFMYWVETAVSNDAHEWRVVDARSPISRFRKHQLEGNQIVQFEGYSINVSFVCASSIRSIRFPSAMSKSFLKIRNPNQSDLPFPVFFAG